ncbi:MAG TPA: precorrin-4 C(11)-methyltransferase [Acidimicrobiales bacterium]|nr:precorrin-4 C(11)-methyltransferase [Acidimicrobiales bacterium]
MSELPAGLISFVGAGPGAADLITLRGAQRLSQADVVIWASSLVPEALLAHAQDGAEVHDSKTMTLEDVLAVYESHPEDLVVRLHSGDPAIYGAIQEQIDWCIRAGRPYEIVPGVSSLAAAAAAIGRELTIPKISQSVVVTRLAGRTKASMPPKETLPAFSAIAPTTAIFLSGARPRELQDELLTAGSGWNESTPAAVVVRASWPDEQVVMTTVGQVADAIVATGHTRTVLVIVGEALRPSDAAVGGVARSHLYSPGFAHSFRKRSLPGTTTGRAVGARRPGTGSRPR